MQNIEQELNGDILILRIDLSKKHGLSKSGKTTRIASSEGNKRIGDSEIFIGVNVYEKIKDGE
jgi:hypothetical protein